MSKKGLFAAGILLSVFLLYRAFPTAKLIWPCAFCQEEVLQKGKIFEDTLVYALYTHKPVMEGHCLIIPKRHVERFHDLTAEEFAQMGAMVKKVDGAVQRAFGTASYLLMQKNGEEVGQTVPHVHIHYMPRQKGDSSILKFLWKMAIASLCSPVSEKEIAERIEQIQSS